MNKEREWIECGRMLSKMPRAVVIYNPYNKKYCCLTNKFETSKDNYVSPDVYDVFVQFEVTTTKDEWFVTRYEAIKYAYFYEVLSYDPSETELTSLELDDETLSLLYKIADTKNITIDEAVIETLKKLIDNWKDYE
jgi:hypothetical protein